MQNNTKGDNDKKLNFAFFGTPDVASETLKILKENGYIPSLVVTSPDKPQGRKMILTPPPVKGWAEKNNIPYIQPGELTPSAFGTSPLPRGRMGRGHDLYIVVAYGKIMPEEILNMPKFGSINIHYSLLPKYRGASPVESAILNGETETGVTIQKMKFKLDSGPIIAQEKVEILPDEKASELRARLIKIGGELLVKTLSTPSAFGHSPFAGGEEQDESQATFCKKIKKEDGQIDLNDDGVKNYNKFRAYAAWPRTFFFKDGKRIIITKARLENNPLDLARGKQFVIEKIIPEGGKEVDYKN
jgi:methionyl-tRNA formyltransferase